MLTWHGSLPADHAYGAKAPSGQVDLLTLLSRSMVNGKLIIRTAGEPITITQEQVTALSHSPEGK